MNQKRPLILKVFLASCLILTFLSASGCGDKNATENPITRLPSITLAAIIEQINASDAYNLFKIDKGQNTFTVLDIRTPAEFSTGYIEGAINIDYNAADFRSQIGLLDRNHFYLMYCQSGKRSTAAIPMFQELGFNEMYVINGGVVAWKAAGFPLVIAAGNGGSVTTTTTPMPLTQNFFILSPALDKNGLPANDGTSFKTDAQQIYLTFNLIDPLCSATVNVFWYFGDEKVPLLQQVNLKQTWPITVSLPSPAGGFKPGAYRAAVLIDLDERMSLPFTLVP